LQHHNALRLVCLPISSRGACVIFPRTAWLPAPRNCTSQHDGGSNWRRRSSGRRSSGRLPSFFLRLWRIHTRVRPYRARIKSAANWLRVPRAAPAPGMVAARRGHVFVLEQHIDGDAWMAYDANSGGRTTRIHARSLRGYTVVNPRAA
jgi:hypothetical protein